MDSFLKKIDTVFIYVRDLEKSIEWYTNILKLKLRWKMEGYAALDVANGETPITLIEISNEDLVPSSREQFNFFTPEIDKVYEYLSNEGVEAEPVNIDGAVKYFTFKDTDGNILGCCYFE